METYFYDESNSDEASQYLGKIESALNSGLGFIPLIGAGFSVPSGSPLMSDLKEYLQKCICVALGLDIIGDLNVARWDPRTDQWPPLIDRERHTEAGAWYVLAEQRYLQLVQQLEELRKTQRLQESQLRDDRERRLSRERDLLARALGAMTDFRQSLVFIAKLQVAGRKETTLSTAPPRQDVVDSFWRHVLKDKMPSLGHRVLGSLAGALRTDTILTTNYDDLIEKGYAAARNPVNVIEIPAGAYLPKCSAIRGARTLIKMHGSRVNLLSDDRLDHSPTDEDVATFASYFEKTPESHSQSTISNHLLVVGFSAEDVRVRALIKAAILRHKELVIFWLSFDDPKVERHNPCRAILGRTEDRQFCVMHTHNPELFLLELFQRLRKSLPQSGCIFPAAARTTIAPFKNERPKYLQIDAVKLGKGFSRIETITGGAYRPMPCICLVTAQKERPLSSAMSDLFREYSHSPKRICIWIDMNDVANSDNLIEVIIEAMSVRVGIEDWIPGWSRPGTPKGKVTEEFLEADALLGLRQEIQRFVKATNRHWTVFLNCREQPGSNYYGYQDGPTDWTSSEASASDVFCKLIAFLFSCGHVPQTINGSSEPLSQPVSGGLTIIAMSTFSSKDDKRVRDAIESSIKEVYISKKANICKYFKFDDIGCFRPDDIVRDVSDWAKSSKRKSRFLCHLVLMQRPRHLASVYSPLLRNSSSVSEAELWLRELEELALLKRVPGGFIWMHSSCRNQLRGVLTKGNQPFEVAEIHLELARWYELVLDSTSAPAGVFEAAAHYAMAARLFGDSSLPGKCVQSLQACRSVIYANRWLIQTHGYSRGSCRHLEAIAEHIETWVRVPAISEEDNVVDEARKVWQVCAEVMRQIAREVGEDYRAFYRHRACRIFTKTDATSWKETSELALTYSKYREEVDSSRREQLDRSNWCVDDVRWRRWSLMLNLASRSYPDDNDPLINFVGLEDERGSIQFNGDQRNRLEALRVMVVVVESLLLRRSVNARIGQHEEARKLALRALVVSGRALKLADRVRHAEIASDAHEVSLANWCEVRLFMLRSDACAYLNTGDPYRELNEAEARLRVSDPRRQATEYAMVDIHRAHARLCEAQRIPFDSLSVWVGSWIAQDMSLIASSVSDVDRMRLRALAVDALRFLDRAYLPLVERRRNVWWSAWYFQRRLFAISLILWSSISEGESAPIPFFGLEFAMRLSKTEPELLLEDALRMIRVDAYRLATVVEAYASCICALEVRIAKDINRDEKLIVRRSNLKELLSQAVGRLDEVYRIRCQVGKAIQASDEVNMFVEKVLSKCTQIVS